MNLTYILAVHLFKHLPGEHKVKREKSFKIFTYRYVVEPKTDIFGVLKLVTLFSDALRYKNKLPVK